MADVTFVPIFDNLQVTTDGSFTDAVVRDFGGMLLRLAERLSLIEAGGVVSMGSLGGQGPKSARFANAQQNAGITPTALGSETARPTRVSRTVGYHDLTVAPYGLEMASTYDGQIFNPGMLAQALSVDMVFQGAPDFAANLIRSLAATAVAAISASVGSSASNTSLDTLIAAASAFNVNTSDPNNDVSPILMLHPQQVEHIKASARAEGALQDSASFVGIQGVELGQIIPNFMGMGMDLVRTNAVTTAASAYQGGLYQRGAVQALFGDTGRVALPPGVRAIRIPELGILVQEVMDGLSQRTLAAQFYQYVGVGMGDTAVYKQTRVLGST